MMLGLRTWWVGAVGTTLLELHVDWRVARARRDGRHGAGARRDRRDGARRSAGARRGRSSPARADADRRRPRGPRPRWLAAIALGAGGHPLRCWPPSMSCPHAGGFFGAGALVLRRRPRRRSRGGCARRAAAPAGRARASSRFGLAQRVVAAGPQPDVGRTRRRGGVPAGVRRRVSQDAPRERRRGFGHGRIRADGRVRAADRPRPRDRRRTRGGRSRRRQPAIRSPASTFVGLRLRPGDDTSCLNLYQPRAAAHPRRAGSD